MNAAVSSLMADRLDDLGSIDVSRIRLDRVWIEFDLQFDILADIISLLSVKLILD